MIKTFIAFFIIIGFANTAYAQTELPEKIIYDQEVIDLVNKAKAEMKAENYLPKLYT